MNEVQELFPTTADHAYLVDKAYEWVNRRCSFAFKELSASWEIPDVIGFTSRYSVLIECKASRSDYFADQKKVFRSDPTLGMGNFRIYCCPKGLISPDEIPEKWGLLYVSNGQARLVKDIFKQEGEHWFDTAGYGQRQEWLMMTSALRRIRLRGHLESIYDNPYMEEGGERA